MFHLMPTAMSAASATRGEASGWSLLPTRSSICSDDVHVFYMASCSDLSAPPSASSDAFSRLAVSLLSHSGYRVNLFVDDAECPERCDQVIAHLVEAPALASDTNSVHSRMTCTSVSKELSTADHQEWLKCYGLELNCLHPSAALRPDTIRAFTRAFDEDCARHVWLVESDVGLIGDWWTWLERYNDAEADYLVPEVKECPQNALVTNPCSISSDETQRPSFITGVPNALVNYTRATNYLARVSPALGRAVVAQRERGAWAHQEVFFKTTADYLRLTTRTIDPADASLYIFDWTASCVPLAYVRIHLFPNEPLSRRLGTGLRQVNVSSAESAQLVQTVMHPIKWDSLADDEKFRTFLSEQADVAPGQWSGCTPPTSTGPTGGQAKWHLSLAAHVELYELCEWAGAYASCDDLPPEGSPRES